MSSRRASCAFGVLPHSSSIRCTDSVRVSSSSERLAPRSRTEDFSSCFARRPPFFGCSPWVSSAAPRLAAVAMADRTATVGARERTLPEPRATSESRRRQWRKPFGRQCDRWELLEAGTDPGARQFDFNQCGVAAPPPSATGECGLVSAPAIPTSTTLQEGTLPTTRST